MARDRALSWGTLVTALGAFVFAWTPLTDRDWPWHLADFERMSREHAFPWRDAFSWASEGDFLPVHWLFELALGLAHRAWGLAGIEVVRVLLVVLAFALLERLLARRGLGPVAASAVALSVAAITRARLLERPHLVTLLGMVLLWDQLVAYRDRKKKTLWSLTPLFLVWANSHPGAIYGTIFATGFATAELLRIPLSKRFPALRALEPARARNLALFVLLAVAATFVTPAGPRLYPYLLGHVSMQKGHHVAELHAIDFTRLEDWLFAAALAFTALLLVRGARGGTGPDLTDLAGTLGFVVLACVAAREENLALVGAAVTLAPVLAETIREAKGELEGKETGLHVFAWAFALTLGFGLPLLALGMQLAEGDLGSGLRPGSYPEREADWILAKKPKGPLWNTNASGGYLIWRLDPLANPGWRVFWDGRQPLYDHAAHMTYAEIEAAMHPNILVLDPLTPPPEGNRWVHENFALVHFSDGGRTYLRQAGPDPELVARFAYRHIAFAMTLDERFGAEDPRRYELHVVPDSENPEEARAELIRGALAEEPGGEWANVALARTLLLLGDKLGAAQAARRALEVRSSHDALEALRSAEGH